jgi:hypothetical protein
MKKIILFLSKGTFVTLLVLLTALGTSRGQSYSMSTDNCTITSNVITFDVMMTNSGPAGHAHQLHSYSNESWYCIITLQEQTQLHFLM